MSPAITFDLRLLIRFLYEHALVSSSNWTMASPVKDGMECLFDADKPYFATWLWIYNDDKDGLSMCTMRPTKPDAVPLYYAASFGFRDLAERLIAEHPEHANANGGKAVTSMHVAAREGYADIMSLLLKYGADVDGRGLSDQTPLHRAAWTAKVDAARCSGVWSLKPRPSTSAPNL